MKQLNSTVQHRFKSIKTIIGPGILVAATGVGAGDLATGALAGSNLGLAIAWAVLLGAFFKYVLSEGLARWQLASGKSLLLGVMIHLGRPVQWFFFGYLIIWTFLVAAALMSACGAAAHALLPFFQKADTGKIVFGIASSVLGLGLVRVGGYRLFEKVMSVCIGVMFITVCLAAWKLKPVMSDLLSGMFIPSIPDLSQQGIGWTVALIGGVGGTVTLLCYGYWIREEGRTQIEELNTCRIDLGVGYLMTAGFGIAMIVIGSRIQVEGRGAGLIIQLADQLKEPLGQTGRWAFLLGAFGAVFSSLLGVWQSVPCLFVELIRIMRNENTEPSDSNQNLDPTRSVWYGRVGLMITVLPMIGLLVGFSRVQKVYAVTGALFVPMMAIALLVLNNNEEWLGKENRNRIFSNTALVAILGFFIYVGCLTAKKVLGG